MKSKIIKCVRVLVGTIGYFMISGTIENMDITNTMTSVHMAYVGIGMILFFMSILTGKVKITEEV